MIQISFSESGLHGEPSDRGGITPKSPIVSDSLPYLNSSAPNNGIPSGL
jgi:hypothetical protein